VLDLGARGLDLSGHAREGGAQLLGVGAAAGGGLLSGARDGGDLVEPVAQRADVRQDPARATVDLVEPLLERGGRGGGAAAGFGALGGGGLGARGGGSGLVGARIVLQRLDGGDQLVLPMLVRPEGIEV
jgi:hypothetical protein